MSSVSEPLNRPQFVMSSTELSKAFEDFRDDTKHCSFKVD